MQAGVLRRQQCSLLQLSSNAKSTSGSESGLGALEAPGWLTWRWQRPTGRRPGSWRPGCFRLGSPPPVLTQAQPHHSGLGRSRLRSHRAQTFRAGPGAQPPMPPKPPSGCWPPGGTCRSAPQGVRTRGAGGLCRKCSTGARLVGEGYVQTLGGEISKLCLHTLKAPISEATSLRHTLLCEVCNIHAS